METHKRLIGFQGYTVLQGFSEDDLIAITDLLRPILSKPDRPNKFHFIHLDPELLTSVLTWAPVQELIKTFCGMHARLDNHFGFAYPARDARPNIHGGPLSESRSCYFFEQAGWAQTSNLKIGIPLGHQEGLAVVPGSHSSQLRANGGNTPPNELLHLRLKPRQVVVFTDALVHGTVESENDRCMLYYTITPGHVAWAQFQEPSWKDEVPVQVQRMIRPPGVVKILGKGDDARRIIHAQPTYQVTK